ncbi:hypothetical protein BJ742DRAFT_774522 [Cladochytrium replicatum]|nr:hypothetical protein BJ742DRAFT_774522 [Cladochytrium replicatum]
MKSDTIPTHSSNFARTRTAVPEAGPSSPTALSPNKEPSPFQNETTQYCNLYNIERTCSYKITLFTKVDKGFFLADEGDGPFWACYRRNYFEISAAFTATDPTNTRLTLPCFIETPQGWHSITQFLVSVTARNSSRKNEIDLIQQTAKRDRSAQAHPPPKPCEPQCVPTPVFNTQTRSCVSFERLQFKTATANNGKRKAVQQYHSLTVEVSAKCEDGKMVLIASTESAPLIVRGRAPGHYMASRSKSVEDEQTEKQGEKYNAKNESRDSAGTETAAIAAESSSRAAGNFTKQEDLPQPLKISHSLAPLPENPNMLAAPYSDPYTDLQSSSLLIPILPATDFSPILPPSQQQSSFPWLPNTAAQPFLSSMYYSSPTTTWTYQNIPTFPALHPQPQSSMYLPTTNEQAQTFVSARHEIVTPEIPTEVVMNLKRKDPPTGSDLGESRHQRARGS